MQAPLNVQRGGGQHLRHTVPDAPAWSQLAWRGLCNQPRGMRRRAQPSCRGGAVRWPTASVDGLSWVAAAAWWLWLDVHTSGIQWQAAAGSSGRWAAAVHEWACCSCLLVGKPACPLVPLAAGQGQAGHGLTHPSTPRGVAAVRCAKAHGHGCALGYDATLGGGLCCGCDQRVQCALNVWWWWTFAAAGSDTTMLWSDVTFL